MISGVDLSPYRIPGMRPSRRDARAPPLPVRARVQALSSNASAMNFSNKNNQGPERGPKVEPSARQRGRCKIEGAYKRPANSRQSANRPRAGLCRLGPPGMRGQLGQANDLDACLGYRMVVLDRAAAHPDGADQHAVLIDDGHAAGEGDQTVVGVLDAVKRLAGLRQLPELTGGHAEEAGGLRLLDGNVDGTHPGVVHAHKGLQIGAGIDDGDAHLRVERDGLLARGLDGFLGVLQIDVHGRSLLLVVNIADLNASGIELVATAKCRMDAG